jgi:hypothetical protein
MFPKTTAAVTENTILLKSTITLAAPEPLTVLLVVAGGMMDPLGLGAMLPALADEYT